MKHLFTIVFLLFAWGNIIAQEISIKGRIIEKKENKVTPFELATVCLLMPDSTLLHGDISKQNGSFYFNKLNQGNYILTVSFIGYETVGILLNNISQNTNIGDIEIKESGFKLEEVSVTANSMIQKIDRQLLFPSKNQVDKSGDTYDLLNKMMISRLQVDQINKSLSVSGGNYVQTRINGIKVTSAEVSAIQPKDIIRIEYMEDPGSQFNDNNLGAIINIITHRRNSGGQITLQAQNSPFVLFGDNFVSFKYNVGKSEWGINYNNRNRGYKKKRRDIFEKYYISDTSIIERTQEGINDKSKDFTNNINLSYNLYTPDKYTLNVIFRNNINNSPYNNTHNKIYIGNIGGEYFSKVYNKKSSYSPSLDIYYQQSLKHNQSLEFNLVGTIIDSKDNREYLEYGQSINIPNVDIISNVEGKKHSIIAEGIYHREFKHIKINTGLRHFQMRAKNTYEGSTPFHSEMQQAESYGFAEIQGRTKKISYGLGLGITRSWFKESEHDKEYYTFSPTVRIGYEPHPNWFIRYTFNIKPSIPSLSSLTNVEQELDTIQRVRGNPLLKTFKMYENNFNINYSKNKFQANFNLKHLYYKDPIMESIFVDNGKIIIQDNNQDYYQQFNIESNIRINGITIGNLPEFLSISVGGGYSNFKSKGLDYKYTYEDYYMNFMAWLSYKKFSLLGQYRRYQSSLFGETITKGEDITLFMLTYRMKDLQLGVSMLYPFTNNYKTGIERKNRYAPMESWNYVKEAGQLIFFQISYNLNFGRKYKSSNKNINNIDTDTGILNTNR